ncbi:hypothetical protein QM312_00850 [Burkholderia cenocepacia]|uniref:hypothetical protein n=1 Tax=Burkholderia cenocepacia TaxID=95486 RepID=UPI0024B68366|nr:hypothetical protein [Burkholderia cenocepacia]MDI9694451.1 hypothetical protein [Burkholderia cenocepacia]
MGKLVESSQWEEDLYQIETADPVEGGPDGVSNKQAKQLGGRTRYLKAQVEQSQSGLAQHIAAADPHSQYATKSDLAARLAALVGQAPGMLDTLKELADALGNDPNFATTITNQLALKAPIDSPVFTGTPKGPTQAQSDNTTALATTAFVQRALGNFQSFISTNTSIVLTAAQSGSVVEYWGTSSITVTLPAMVKNLAYAVLNTSTYPVTIAGVGGSFYSAGTFSESFVLQPGTSAQVVGDGINWVVYNAGVGVTPAQFDSSTKLATTAFVQQSNGNFQARQVVYGATSITNAASGSWIECAGVGGYTITLPSPSATNLSFTFSNVSNGVVTLATPSANIYDQGSPATTFQIDQNAVVKVSSDGNWVVIDCYSPNPKATTAALGDNSKRLATTAWYWNQIAAGVSSAGKLGGVNSPNLLFNGSGEFGLAGGWGPGGFINAYNSGNGDGTFFANAAAISANSYAGSMPIPMAPEIPLCISGEIYAVGVTSGKAFFRLVYLDASGNVITTSANITATNGSGWTFASSSVTTPSNTASVYVQLAVEGPGASVSSGGLAWRRLKLERGGAPSLYSQETSIGTLAGGLPVVGTARNVAMNVAATSSTATLTAGEIIVCSGLGGVAYKIANFSKTINLAITGAGGMDSGSAPTSGYIAIYAIYNPSTGVSALLATNCTGSIAPEVYNAGSMPAGYSASALISVWSTDSNGRLSVGYQRDRKVAFADILVLTTTAVVNSPASLSIASAVPKNATRVRFHSNIISSTTQNVFLNVFTDANQVGGWGGGVVTTNFGYVGEMMLATPQTVWYMSGTVSATFQLFCGGYEF